MSMFDRLEDTLRRYEDVTAELGNPDIVGKYEDFHDRKTKESYKLTDNGEIVSEKTAKLLNVKEGDTINLTDGMATGVTVNTPHICDNYM